jgi:hypothetical protein
MASPFVRHNISQRSDMEILARHLIVRYGWLALLIYAGTWIGAPFLEQQMAPPKGMMFVIRRLCPQIVLDCDGPSLAGNAPNAQRLQRAAAGYW